jgi:hypothetical protein
MPDASNAPVSPAVMLPFSEPLQTAQQLPFDPADAFRAGVTPQVYNSFLNDISGLNTAHRAGTLTTDDYVRRFSELTSQYGVNPVVRDGDRVLYFNPGIQFGSAQYDISPNDRDLNPAMDGFGTPNVWEVDRGQAATASALYPGGQPFSGFETQPLGTFIGDARTRNEGNFLGNLGTGFLNSIINYGVGAGLGALGGAAGSVFGGGEGGVSPSPLGPRLDSGSNNDRVVVDGERLNREQSADFIMQQVLAGLMGNRERFEIPAVENPPPETIEFPIEMPRLPVEAEAEQTEEGGGSAEAEVVEPEQSADAAPLPPEDVFGEGSDATQPDEERRWRYIGDGIFVNIDTGARRRGGDGDFTVGEVYSGPSEEVAGEDDDLFTGIFDVIGGGGALGSSIDSGIDFGPFAPGVVGGSGVGTGTGTGTGSGEGSGDGNRPSSSQPSQSSLAVQQKEFEKYMTQVRYQVQMMQRPEFMLRDYLAELMR